MTIKEFLKKCKWFVIILASIPILTVLVFSLFADILHRFTLSGGDWAAFIGTILTYIGTALLGLLAFWQNTRFKEENDKSQASLLQATEKLKEANEIIAKEYQKQVDINKRLLEIQEFSQMPMVKLESFVGLNEDDKDLYNQLNKKIGLELQCNSVPTKTIDFLIDNIGEIYISSIEIYSFYGKDNKEKAYIYHDYRSKNNRLINNHLAIKERKRLVLTVDQEFSESFRNFKIEFLLTRIDGKKYIETIEFDTEPLLNTIDNQKMRIEQMEGK